MNEWQKKKILFSMIFYPFFKFCNATLTDLVLQLSVQKNIYRIWSSVMYFVWLKPFYASKKNEYVIFTTKFFLYVYGCVALIN